MNSLSKSQKIAFIALLVAAIVLIAGGAFGVVNRTRASGEQMLSDMRLTALLTTAGEGSKEALVEAEVEAAREAARAAGGLKIIGTERHEARRIDNQPVSYTHLDVYKRQAPRRPLTFWQIPCGEPLA